METKCVYPAIFYKAIEGGYYVIFPDLGCVTQGEDIKETFFMAENCLGTWLYDFFLKNKDLPTSSNIKDVVIDEKEKEFSILEDSFVSLVGIDLGEYAKKCSKKVIRKNVAIPSYLNEMAKNMNINVSKVLKDALEKEFNL